MRKMMMKMTRLCDKLMNDDDYDDADDADDADEDYKTMWQADCSGRLTALKWIVPRRWSSSWPKRTGLFRISLSWWRLEEVDGVPLQVSSGYNHHDGESLVGGYVQDFDEGDKKPWNLRERVEMARKCLEKEEEVDRYILSCSMNNIHPNMRTIQLYVLMRRRRRLTRIIWII